MQGGRGYFNLSEASEHDPTMARALVWAHIGGNVRAVKPNTVLPGRMRAVMIATVLMAAGAAAAWIGPRHFFRPVASLRGSTRMDEEEIEVTQVRPESETKHENATSFCSDVEDGVEFHTQAPLYWKDGIVSSEMCCAECDADPDCGAWTWGKTSGVEGLSHRCFLKKLGSDETPRRFEREGLVSGLPARSIRKHGVVAGLLAREAEDKNSSKAPIAHEGSAMCPGTLSVSNEGLLFVVGAEWYRPDRKAAELDASSESWSIAPKLLSRAYLAHNCTDDAYNHSDYAALKLLGRTLRYTVDLSGAGCGCNAQLHLAPMRSNNKKSQCHDYSCSAASTCGEYCTEFSVQDANQYAWSSGLSARVDEAPEGIGYGGGGGDLLKGRRDWSSSQYGPGAKCVDTTWPFKVAVAFHTSGDGELDHVEVRLSQENKPCDLTARLDEDLLGGSSDLARLSEVLLGGVTPVVSYESSTALDWLDGIGADGQGPCAEDSPEACAASVRFFNFAITNGTALADSKKDKETLPEMAVDLIHEHMVQKAKDARQAKVAEAESLRFVTNAGENCGDDCDTPQSGMTESDMMRMVQGTDDNATATKINRTEDKGNDKGNEDNAKSESSKLKKGTGEYAETASGNAEWEVVTDMVHVRSETDSGAKILGDKHRGDILVGKREGGWIRLRHQPGFVSILDEDNSTALLKERIVTYEKIASGTCRDHGLYPIEDLRACEAAAFVLGYYDFKATMITENVESPPGCFLHHGSIFLSTSSLNEDTGVEGGRFAICASGAYPTTTTTTTTTTFTVTLTTTTTTTWGYPSLFCFEVMMRTTYEYGLVKRQIHEGVGIFTCDEYAVFSQDAPFSLGFPPYGLEVKAIWFKKAPVWKSEDNTAANALLFMNVFKAIKKDGRWMKHHWTIKADPDAVVLPWRIRDHLKPATNQNNYLVNCNKMNWKPPFPMIFGAFEAYSNQSLTHLFSGGAERCASSLPWKAWGEDKYMGNCMKFLGVQPLNDFTILADNRCLGADCNNAQAAVYHDFKTQESWFKCWHQATR